jgi:competence protein ComEA
MVSAASRHLVRLSTSRFAKPAARLVGLAAGLTLLAVVGRNAGAMGSAPSPSAISAVISASAIGPPGPPSASAPPPSSPDPAATESASAPAANAPRGPASSDDPVTLNTATFEDLRRLPGVGAKRASAILALRTHLGRFRAVEDLLKVKGIGRAMLKRLRPLVRLDPSALDGGAVIAARP